MVGYSPPPRAEAGLRLGWERFSCRAHVKADHERIACEHELICGAIIKVICPVSLAAIARGGQARREGETGESPISEGDFEEAIRSERGKNG